MRNYQIYRKAQNCCVIDWVLRFFCSNMRGMGRVCLNRVKFIYLFIGLVLQAAHVVRNIFNFLFPLFYSEIRINASKKKKKSELMLT